MAKIIQSISYKIYYILVSSNSDLSLLVKKLVEDKVFELEMRYSTKNTEFVDLLYIN